MPSRVYRVLVDTNVALDLLLARQPFVNDALQLFALGEAGRAQLLLSTDAISTIFFVVSKNQNAATAREAICKLLDLVGLAALDERAVLRGMSLDFEDIEDALVAAVAEKEGVDLIVTRNQKDFKNSPVPVMAPAAFLALASVAGQEAGEE